MKTGCNGAYYKTKQPAHEMTNVQAAFVYGFSLR